MPIETDPLPVVGFQTNTEHGFQFELNGTKCATGLRSAVELINGGLAILYEHKADTREVMAQLVVFGQHGMTEREHYAATSMLQYLYEVEYLDWTEATAIMIGQSKLRAMQQAGSA